MDAGLGQQGVLSVVPEADLQKQDQARDAAYAASQQPQAQDPSQLATYIRSRYEIFRNHRNTAAGWNERMLESLRIFNGQYNQTQLMEIRRFGGSEIYCRVLAQKCRAASSLLRDVYLNADRPWSVRPPAQPDIDPQILQSIETLLQQEGAQIQQQLGKQPGGADMENRRQMLMDSAADAAKKKAAKQAHESEDRIEDMLRAGGYYHALAEFIVDLPIFPFACLKGPVVKLLPTVTWPPGGGQPTVKMKPTLTWCRVSPFDIWFTPGVGGIEDAEVVEKLRYTRSNLNDLLDLPGYNQNELRAVLDEYGRGGLYDAWDTTDAERAVLESRENPAWNRSGMITCLEYHGNVQGRLLQEYGLAVPDELRDYSVEAWLIGSHVIKCHMNPSPRQRHPYFITSFEKVPGTPVGNSLLDLLADIGQAANATLRSLINNMAIASGPQVVLNDDRMSPDETGADLYPWKRWHTRSDPVGNNNQPPVQFFMPTANAQQLLEVFGKFISIADDVSAIPKYVGGSGDGSGAGRTASGLAMLMGNTSKILQTVSANIDRDVVELSLMQLADLILLTDQTGTLTGEEKISVLGVSVAIQRETIRQRQIEFLQATLNPTDQKIVGIKGRGEILRSVASTLGLPDQIVPSEDTLDRMMKQEEQEKAQGPVAQMVQEGVNKGIEAGIQRITTELTSGEIAAQIGMPEGGPTHIGTLPGQGGQQQPQGGPPGQTKQMPNGLGQGSSVRGAQVGSGTKPKQLAQGGMSAQTHLMGSQPGKDAKPISGGVG